MSEWSYENYKGFQLGKWSDSKHFFVLRDCDINNPIIKGLENADEYRTYIDSLKALEELNAGIKKYRKEDFIPIEVGSILVAQIIDAEQESDWTCSYGSTTYEYYALVSHNLKFYFVSCKEAGAVSESTDFDEVKDIIAEGIQYNVDWVLEENIFIQEKGKIYA